MQKKVDPLKVFLFIVVSGASYYCAVVGGLWTSGLLNIKSATGVISVGGLIGGIIVLVGFRLFVSKLRMCHTIAALIFATAIPGILQAAFPPVSGAYDGIWLFILWQTAVLLILGHALWKEKQKELSQG